VISKAEIFEGSMEPNWNFQRGGEGRKRGSNQNSF